MTNFTTSSSGAGSAPAPKSTPADDSPATDAVRFDVLTIGNAIVDIIARVDDAFLATHDRIKGSMGLVDEEMSAQLYQAMPPASEHSGGSAGNTAAGIAVMGGRAAYIGKVKDDQLGRVFAHDISAAGVHFATERAADGPATATSMILVTPDAQRTMNTYLGACVGLTPADIDEAVVAASLITYVEGYLWDTDSMKQAVLTAISLAHHHGRRFALSLSDSFCVDRFRAEFQDLVATKVDILFANEAEITSLYQVDSLEDALLALEALPTGPDIAVITRSEKGCLVLHAGGYEKLPAARARVVDTTGAGDLFAAGFLMGLARGYDCTVCGALGAAAAAVVIEDIGGRPNEGSLKAAVAGILSSVS